MIYDQHGTQLGEALYLAVLSLLAVQRKQQVIGPGLPQPKIIEAVGYPKAVVDRKGKVMWVRRGIDKRCLGSKKYPGTKLREIRADKGVGRPPGTVPEYQTPPMVEVA